MIYSKTLRSKLQKRHSQERIAYIYAIKFIKVRELFPDRFAPVEQLWYNIMIFVPQKMPPSMIFTKIQDGDGCHAERAESISKEDMF